jgi:hypothetical protein
MYYHDRFTSMNGGPAVLVEVRVLLVIVPTEIECVMTSILVPPDIHPEERDLPPSIASPYETRSGGVFKQLEESFPRYFTSLGEVGMMSTPRQPIVDHHQTARFLNVNNKQRWPMKL